MKRWTKEEENYLINNFKDMKYKDIADKLSVTENALRAKCFDLGLVKNNRWSEDEILYLKKNYQNMSCKEMGLKLNRTENSIRLKLKKIGLNKSPYYCDYSFFKNIDTEDKAYWLGFLFADGYISVNKNTNSGYIGIELQQKDINHLKKFNKSINGNYKIYKRFKNCNLGDEDNEYIMCCIRIYSINMVNDLISHNLLENKTYKKEYPVVSNELMCHFIRGFFDGDGCVRNKKVKNHIYGTCDFTSLNIDFLQFIRSYIYDNLNVNSYIGQEKSGVYRLFIHSNENSIKLLDYMYGNSSIYLDRKNKIYKEIKDRN